MQYIVTSLGSTYSPTVTSVNGPAAIAAGTQGTWNITVNTNNPSYYNNYLTVSVRWGDENTYGYAANAPQQATAASASQTLSFTHSYLTNSTYTIVFTVTNQNGQSTVSSQTVSVSGNNVSSGGVPVLSYISPLQARVGTQLILQGSQFSSYNNVVHFGSGGSLHVPSVNGNTIYYTIPSYVSPCDVQAQGGVCAAFYSQPITPGSTYPVYVSNANGQTSPISMTVQ
jgi:hypothetical protein